MRLMFVCYALHHQGSAQDIYNYIRVGEEMGHEIFLYGPEDAPSYLKRSSAIETADAVVIVLETNMFLHYGGHLNLVRLLAAVPRRRRVVIDCDGKFNSPIRVSGDSNHKNAGDSKDWIERTRSLSDKICQASLAPLRNDARSFLFHAYNPDWEVPLDLSAQPYGMVYVGNNWHRWRPMLGLLAAIEPFRERLNRICLVGDGWQREAWWAKMDLPKEAYQTDGKYLRSMKVEVEPPCAFVEAIDWMSRAIFNPVIYRPLFNRLQMVTCRTFETPAANTIPLFAQDKAYVRAVFGEQAAELCIASGARKKILDVIEQPQRYVKTVQAIRSHLAKEHSYARRFRELLEIIES